MGNEVNAKQVVVFRPQELIYRSSFSNFHNSKNSIFADGYDIEKEKNEIHAISLKSNKSDDELARFSEFEARMAHIEKRIKHKLNIRGNKRHGFDLDDFNIVVRETESPDMPAFGVLESVNEDVIILQTKDAARALIGVPKNSREYQGYPGIKQGINALSVIWSFSDLDNPYVDFVLWSAEKTILELNELIARKTASVEKQIAKETESGIKISIMQNTMPQEMTIQFKSPYGFNMLKLVSAFDRFVCLAYTLSYRGVITKREYKDMMHSIKHKMIQFCIELQTKRGLVENEAVKKIKRSHWLSVEGDVEKFNELVELVNVLQILPPNNILCRDVLAERSKEIENGQYTSDVKARLIEVNEALALKFGLKLDVSGKDDGDNLIESNN